jgi:Holliday junction resolvase
MGKSQRNKGRRFEQEIVNILKDSGVPAKRISMMETGGIDKGDILVAESWKGEVKGGKQIPDFVYKARKNGEDILFMKGDRKQWLILMDVDFFLSKFL